MGAIRRALLAITLMAGVIPAFAQAPAPVPALPDAERRTAYSISGTNCACAVGFQLYGDSTDYQSWVEVWLNGVQVTYNDPAFGWIITSPSGPLANLARPITDAVLTFNAVQTGTVQIVGARRPRRTSTFNENNGVPTRNFNQVLNDLTAQNRELWDKTNDLTGRGLFVPPGETMPPLPPAAQRANMGMCFDSNGHIVPCIGIPSGSFAAGGGISFTGTGPTSIAANIAAGNGIAFTGTAPIVISLPPGSPISVVTYGVVCDGTQHSPGNETGFQNALNAAIAAGSFLQIPANSNCVLNASITNSGTFINTLIRGFGLTSQITFLGNFGFNFGATASYYVMQDISINCAITSNSPCAQIVNASQSTVDGSVIQRVRFNHCGVQCLHLQNMVETNILDNVFITEAASGSAALSVDNTQTADVGSNIIQGNTSVNIQGATIYGIYMLNVGGTQTRDNNVGGYSYDIYSDNSLSSGSATGILIQGNQLDNYLRGGIYFNSAGAGGGVFHVSVSSNTLHALQGVGGIGSLGIAFAEAPGSVQWIVNATITGNTIDTFSGTGGILVAGTANFSVTGNAIFDEGSPTGAGIKTNASSSACVLVGNAVSVYGTHVTNSAGCTVAGNN